LIRIQQISPEIRVSGDANFYCSVADCFRTDRHYERRLLNQEDVMRKNPFRNCLRFASDDQNDQNDLNDQNGLNKDNTDHGSLKTDGISNYSFQVRLVDAYGELLRQQWEAGWDVYLFTFVFKQIPGPRDAKLAQMFQEITKVFGRLVTRTVRKPRSPRWAAILPRGVFVADRPVPKGCNRKLDERQVLPNDGLHVHGLVAGNRLGRISGPLDKHFREHRDEYLIDHIEEIDVQPITHKPAYVGEYGAKGLKRRSFSSDDVLVLPKGLDELPSKTPRCPDPIQDIQTALNVSEESAKEIYRDPKLFQSLVGDRPPIRSIQLLKQGNSTPNFRPKVAEFRPKTRHLERF
jgi:hypothetical protein